MRFVETPRSAAFAAFSKRKSNKEAVNICMHITICKAECNNLCSFVAVVVLLLLFTYPFSWEGEME